MEELSCEMNDMEVAKKMEDEHLRLQRQVGGSKWRKSENDDNPEESSMEMFRVIQTDRHQRCMGVHPMFRRQDNLLRALKEEYISLTKDLKIARSGAHKKKDKKMKNDLKTALRYRTETETNCNGGLAMMEELDELLQRNKKIKLHYKKLLIATEGELAERRFASEHRLVSAENKLETAMLRFNTLQHENKKIREEIEHMLKDRALFKQEWERMLTALCKGKKFLADLFDSSSLAYDQRDEWCNKLKSIQEKGKMDQLQQIQEMCDLRKAYDHEMKTYTFLAKKGVIRINKKEEQRQEQKKKEEADEMRNQYEYHNKLLEDIEDFQGETKCKKIIEIFETYEQQNFSIYLLLTEYCAENEVLRRDLEKIKQDVYDRHDFIDMENAKYDNKVKDLVDRLEQKRAINEALREKIDKKNKLLKRTMENINEVFKMLDCSLEPFENLLGDKQPSFHQLNLTLRLIYDKIKGHIEIVNYHEHYFTKERAKKEGKEFLRTTTSALKKYTVRAELPVIFTPTPINLLVPSDPCPSCIETRWMSRVCEAPEVPFEKQQVIEALLELSRDPAYLRSDRVHPLDQCRATASRKLLATRHLNTY